MVLQMPNVIVFSTEMLSIGNCVLFFLAMRNAYGVFDNVLSSFFGAMQLLARKRSTKVRMHRLILPFRRWSPTGYSICLFNLVQPNCMSGSTVNNTPSSGPIRLGWFSTSFESLLRNSKTRAMVSLRKHCDCGRILSLTVNPKEFFLYS